MSGQALVDEFLPGASSVQETGFPVITQQCMRQAVMATGTLYHCL